MSRIVRPHIIFRSLLIGLLSFLLFYILFLVKINKLEFKWVSNSIGFCAHSKVGVKIYDKEIFSIDTTNKQNCL